MMVELNARMPAGSSILVTNAANAFANLGRSNIDSSATAVENAYSGTEENANGDGCTTIENAIE